MNNAAIVGAIVDVDGFKSAIAAGTNVRIHYLFRIYLFLFWPKLYT